MSDSPQRAASAHSDSEEMSSRRGSVRRWVIGTVFVVFLGAALYQVINPYPDQPYMEIPHGDHVHYVPKDRNQDVSVSQFPMQPPGPNERITPDGRIVTEP